MQAGRGSLRSGSHPGQDNFLSQWAWGFRLRGRKKPRFPAAGLDRTGVCAKPKLQPGSSGASLKLAELSSLTTQSTKRRSRGPSHRLGAAAKERWASLTAAASVSWMSQGGEPRRLSLLPCQPLRDRLETIPWRLSGKTWLSPSSCR